MNYHHNVRFILINTTHPGNIGASARAIKNMDFTELVLVSPRNFPDPDAFVRASGAEDILEKAEVVSSFQEAVHNCHVIFGTSARKRSLPIPLLTAHEGAAKMYDVLKAGQNIAILFGQERTGLTNEELAACHYHLMIPCNPNFASLNLAAAVQIIAYELHLLIRQSEKELVSFPKTRMVNAEERENFYRHLEQTLINLEFLDRQNPRLLMRKLRRLFNRIPLEENEMNILRGILGMVNKKISF